MSRTFVAIPTGSKTLFCGVIAVDALDGEQVNLIGSQGGTGAARRVPGEISAGGCPLDKTQPPLSYSPVRTMGMQRSGGAARGLSFLTNLLPLSSL
jgi:hypothetical protein